MALGRCQDIDPPLPFAAVQMNLSLFNPAMIVPESKQEELTLALTELLINAAQENGKLQSEGARNESETNA